MTIRQQEMVVTNLDLTLQFMNRPALDVAGGVSVVPAIKTITKTAKTTTV